jgi:TonB family protein
MRVFVFVLLVLVPALGFSQASDRVQDTTKEEMIYDMPEIMPKYPGGPDALDDFLKSNLKYPPAAKEKGIQGKVYVQFVVEKDGSITNVEVRRGVNPLLDAEALRVAKLLPNFEPGTMRGKKVRVRYTLPVAFVL